MRGVRIIMRKLSVLFRVAAVVVAAALAAGAAPLAAQGATYPSDSAKPDLVSLLSGLDQLWQSDGTSDLHGTVKDADTLAHNDEIAVWINNNATVTQQFRALQDANYDPSQLVSTALGSALGPIYLKGRQNGALPLTSSVMSSMLAYVSTDAAKGHYNYPRPYLPATADAQGSACNASQTNSSALASNRAGKPYADAVGDLDIVPVPDTADTTGQFASNPTTIGANYGGFCTSPSFPSGHTTNAYLSDLTLATLLPELAPQLLARASEAANDRIVLGVHYPLDIVGGRISGEAGVAARWSDGQYRRDVLEPARQELVSYLEKQCGASLASCIAGQTPYQDDPYGGKAIPGGTTQKVTDEASALSIYRERLTYGFARVGAGGRAPSVPTGASSLLIAAFPTLTDAQRTSVLAQTEIDSGYPLDGTGTSAGSWQRLDLAAAMTATVQLHPDATVTVTKTGGSAQVVSDSGSPVISAPEGDTVMAGQQLALVGAGFDSGSSYRVVWSNDHSTVLGSLAADQNGGVSTKVTIPADAPAGDRSIDVLDSAGKSVLAAPLAITVTVPDDQQSVTTKSPDGKTSATVFIDSSGSLGYTVAQNGETVVQRSRLGLVIGGTDWGSNVSLGDATASSKNESYPLIGDHDTAVNDYRANTIPVRKAGAGGIAVEIRVFDTGVALRYDLDPTLAGQSVSSEETTFAFSPDSTITYQKVSPSTVDDLQGDTTQALLSDLGQQQITVLPTIETPSHDEYANITEANVRDWPAIALTTSASGSLSTYYWATDSGDGTFAVSGSALHSPFRVLTVAPDLTGLTESDIVTNVNDPVDTSVFPGGDTSWITPSVSAWASLDQSVGQNQSVSVIQRLIDSASDARMPEVLIEGQLADPSWGSTTAQRLANVKTLVQRGLAEKNPVHVWLWMDYNHGAGADSSFTDTIDYSSHSPYPEISLQNPDFRDAYLDLVAQTGLVGIKVDHIGDETETKVDLYGDVDRAAAQRHLMVEFHNPLEPTGLNRTYPNEIGREAIRGAEINYAADQDTMIPFTRYVDGPADYTPLLFSNSSKLNNATWAHEVASTVLYTNPYLQISENPANIAPGGIYHSLLGDMVANLPTTWKKSWVLPQSQIGGRVAGVVRQTGDGEYWLAVVATPGTPQSLSIPLDFLPAGTTYNADVYADRQSPSSLSRSTTTVTNATTLTPTLASGGGYLVRITTKAIDNPGGGGSGPDVFTIASTADLAQLAQHPDGTFTVTKDITAPPSWTPVPIFTGTINGNGHTISGLRVDGDASKAFIGENQGTIRQLGFVDASSVVTGAYVQSTRVAIVAVTNDGTIDQVYTKNADVEGGWRSAPIAAENTGSITNSYTLDSTVVANWEAGAIVAWNSNTALLKDTYVAGANVTSVVSNGGILAGYGYQGTQVTGDVVYSGSLSIASSGNQGRVVGRENGTPSYADNLALDASTINGAAVTGGAIDNKNGKDTSAADLATPASYTAIGWDFDTVWKWDDVVKRPVLLTVAELPGDDTPPGGGTNSFDIGSEADLALLAQHPDGTFAVTADITMTQPWTPVPTFTGTIEGNGHTITGLVVDGGASKAFIGDNRGVIRRLGFTNATSTVPAPYVQSTRVAIVAVTNDGTIDQVYTKDADVEGGWRTAPIAAENTGTVSNSYTVDSKVVSNWETGALVAWNQNTGILKNTYVAGADVTAVTSNGGILTGYGYMGTQLVGNVVYSGSLSIPANGNLGRIVGRENGAPTFTDNLALDTSTINGAPVAGGTASNKNGKDASAAELRSEATYIGIGWDFDGVWKWDAALQRPVLAAVQEPQPRPTVTVKTSSLNYQVGTAPDAGELLTAAGAATSAGTLTVDSTDVHFETPGDYTVRIGADNDGTLAADVLVTVHVVPVIAVQVQHETLRYQVGIALTAAQVEADAGASLTTAGVLIADLTAIDAMTPGTYPLVLSASDSFGFFAAPREIHVVITSGPAAPAAASLTAPNGTTVAVGGTLVLSGTAFDPGQSYDVTLHSDPVLLGRAVANRTGAFGLTVTIPADTPAGAHTIDVTDPSGVSALTTPLAITVTRAAGPVPTAGTPLAFTGATISSWALLSALLAIAFGIVLASTRRPRRGES